MFLFPFPIQSVTTLQHGEDDEGAKQTALLRQNLTCTVIPLCLLERSSETFPFCQSCTFLSNCMVLQIADVVYTVGFVKVYNSYLLKSLPAGAVPQRRNQLNFMLNII